MIQLYGIPKIFDMIHFEHNHKGKVKGPFAKTTQNFGNIDSEMLRKLESTHMIVDARDISRLKFHKKMVFEEKKGRLTNTVFYKPASDLKYEAYMTSSTTQRVFYHASSNTFRTLETARFANPLVHATTISAILCDGLQGLLSEDVWKGLKLNNDTVMMHYCKQFKVDPTSQGKPPFSLTCSIRNHETSGEDSRSYRRFDWVSDTNGTFFTFINTFYYIKNTFI